MKYLLLLLPIYAFGYSSPGPESEVFKGYIVTKNGIKLTGQIGTVTQSARENSVIFINDFGNIYTIYPQLIKGFAFEQDSSAVLFESKIERYEKKWVFMKVLCKGKGLNLYINVSERYNSLISPYETRTKSFKTKDFFLEVNGKIPFKVKRLGFKKQIHKLVQRRAPALANKIGQKGYRYKDLVNIINQYNDVIQKSKRFL